MGFYRCRRGELSELGTTPCMLTAWRRCTREAHEPFMHPERLCSHGEQRTMVPTVRQTLSQISSVNQTG